MLMVVLLVLFYCWIGAIHALFTGVTTFALLGKRAQTWHPFSIFFLLFLLQAFLETYWIGIVDQLGFQLKTTNESVLRVFGKTAQDNLIRSLTPG